MSGVWGLVACQPGSPPCLRTGLTVDQALERLEAGESPQRLLESFHLTTADLIALLGHAALGDDQAEEGIGLVQSPPSRPWLEPVLSDSTWRTLLPSAPKPARLALVAGLFQVHDFWEASHEAAQQADDLGERAVSAYWHGIAHRREPDSGNASYWFRRVGQHPIFVPLADSVRPLLTALPDRSAGAPLLDGNRWNPFGFIAFCHDGTPPPALAPLSRRLQRREMIALLNESASALLSL
ncbi:hypothetical protein SAMN05444166_6917 [Singulisphaera sp. GP187]|uniref:DUF433 domain-containing protein n=1 Tax=Singulisphaera sp. GP187 TaxID=1882752 RepID=UPI00092744BB|nr:DUF433 domain-containing protein [Singulisphaera sp. GP187]SIO61997.1 hypothetical protein SAMN05444166_6917 [Singulisphaera sp. GP187]